MKIGVSPLFCPLIRGQDLKYRDGFVPKGVKMFARNGDGIIGGWRKMHCFWPRHAKDISMPAQHYNHTTTQPPNHLPTANLIGVRAADLKTGDV